jgi:ribosomal silencing factor RsfS
MRYHVVNTSEYNNGKVIFSTNSKAEAKLLADNIADSFKDASITVYEIFQDAFKDWQMREIYHVERTIIKLSKPVYPNTTLGDILPNDL